MENAKSAQPLRWISHVAQWQRDGAMFLKWGSGGRLRRHEFASLGNAMRINLQYGKRSFTAIGDID